MTSFFIARAYHDISAALRGELLRTLRGAQRRAVFIVPDQFEFETEKSIYGMLRENDMLACSGNVRVATFADISAEIIALCNEKKRTANDVVKNIIMQRIIRENKDRLGAFAGVCDKPGFCAKMVQTVTMLKTAGITPYDLSEQAISDRLSAPDEGRRSIKRYSIAAQKLRDVGLLYLEYNARLERDWLDRLDCTERAAELLASGAADVFGGADVFVDGFNDFTNSQLHFLKSVFCRAENVTFGFAAERSPANEGRAELFLTINSQIDRLYDYAREAAEENGGKPPVFVTEGFAEKTASPLLREVSDRLFGGERCACENDGALDVITAADSAQEMDFVAAKIKELTALGMRYSDIAVLCAGSGESMSCLKTAFSRYAIPAFFDIPEPVLHQPLFALVTSLLDVLEEFTTERVLSYIKTGFAQKQVTVTDDKGRETTRSVGLTGGDINAFETFMFEWALTAQALKKPLTECGGLNGGDERSKEANKRAAQAAEAVREAAVAPLLELREKLSRPENRYGDKITALLLEFLVDKVGVSREIAARTTKTDKSGAKLPDALAVRAYQKLWDSLSGIFDAMHTGLSGYPLSVAEYARIFREICSQTTIASPPQYVDTVLVGDIDRTRTPNVKAVFIVGAGYDTFPPQTGAQGVFSEFETQLIRENIIHIDSNDKKEYCLKSAKEQYCLSLYRVYRALSLPSDYLCISCPEADAAGAEITRSEVTDGLLALVGMAQPASAGAFGAEFYARSTGAAKLMFSQKLFSPDSDGAALSQALCNVGEGGFVSRLTRLKTAHTTGERRAISAYSAGLLFPPRVSATDIEKLCKCRFSYFCDRGLRIRERTQHTFNAIERGNAVHYVLEKILAAYADKMEQFITLGRGELAALVRARLAEYRAERLAELITDDARTDFLFKNLENAALDVLTLMQAEFSGRAYRPKLFEVSLADEAGEHTIAYRTEDMQYFLSDALPEESADEKPLLPPEAQEKKLMVAPLEVQTKSGKKIQITGTIDRVDLFMSRDGTQYLRVVDYKTNTHSFSIPKALNGVNIQMLLYLFALCNANAGNPDSVSAGGVSYNPAKVTGAINKRLTALELLATKYKQNGMLVSDSATLEESTRYAASLLDRISAELAADSSAKSDILPDNDPQEREKAIGEFMPDPAATLTKEGFENLRADCSAMLSQTLSGLHGGDVAAVPVRYKDTTLRKPCTYCRFASICGNAGEVRNISEDIDMSRYIPQESEESR